VGSALALDFPENLLTFLQLCATMEGNGDLLAIPRANRYEKIIKMPKEPIRTLPNFFYKTY
jgi:hypothetical protein